MLYTDFVQWAFYGLLSFAFISMVKILGEIKDSVENLNQKIAVVVEKTHWHEKSINDLHDRVKEIEQMRRESMK